MRLSLNIVGKDLRRLALPWVAWLILLVVQQVVTADSLRGGDFGAARYYEFQTYLHAIALIELTFLFLIAALPIQEDSLLDPDADWMTRPISKAMLFGAKILGSVLMFWLPPVIISMPGWLSSHYQPEQIVRAALETFLVYGFVATSAALISANAKGWLQFLMVAVIVAAINAWAAFVFSFGIIFGSLSIGWVSLMLITLVVCTYISFRERTANGAAGRLVLAFFGVMWIGSLARPTGSNAEFPQTSSDPLYTGSMAALPSAAHLKFEGAKVLYSYPFHYHLTALQYSHFLNSLHFAVTADAIRPGTILVGRDTDWELIFPDGLRERRNGPLLSDRRRSRRAEEEVLGLPLSDGPATMKYNGFMRLPSSMIARTLKDRPDFKADLNFELLEGHIKLRIPLKEESRAFSDGRGIRIAKIRLEPSYGGQFAMGSDGRASVEVILAETLANPWRWLDVSRNDVGLTRSEERGENSNGQYGTGGYALVNRATGEFVPMEFIIWPDQDFILTGSFGWRILKAAIPISRNTDTEEKVRTWIANAELVHIVFEPVRSYRASIEEPKLKIEIEQMRPVAE